jgi:hypothetical protein
MVLPRNHSFPMHCNFSYRHFLYLKASRKSREVCMRDQINLDFQFISLSQLNLRPQDMCKTTRNRVNHKRNANLVARQLLCSHVSKRPLSNSFARTRNVWPWPGNFSTIAYLIIKRTYRFIRVSQTSICETNLSCIKCSPPGLLQQFH